MHFLFKSLQRPPFVVWIDDFCWRLLTFEASTYFLNFGTFWSLCWAYCVFHDFDRFWWAKLWSTKIWTFWPKPFSSSLMSGWRELWSVRYFADHSLGFLLNFVTLLDSQVQDLPAVSQRQASLQPVSHSKHFDQVCQVSDWVQSRLNWIDTDCS